MFDLSFEYEHENRKIQYVSDAPSWIFSEMRNKKINNIVKNRSKICKMCGFSGIGSLYFFIFYFYIVYILDFI